METHGVAEFRRTRRHFYASLTTLNLRLTKHLRILLTKDILPKISLHHIHHHLPVILIQALQFSLLGKHFIHRVRHRGPLELIASSWCLTGDIKIRIWLVLHAYMEVLFGGVVCGRHVSWNEGRRIERRRVLLAVQNHLYISG